MTEPCAMTDLLRQLRNRIVDTPDSVCLDRARLVTEAWKVHEAKPAALRRAAVFRHVLEHLPLDLDSNPYFAGNTSSKPHAWMLLPEYGFFADGQILIENENLQGILDGDAVPDDLREYWADRTLPGNGGVGHLAVDLNRVVNAGLNSILAELTELQGQGDAEAQRYRQAMRIGLEAVIDWAGRYADAAARAADSTDDATLAALHRRVAEACRHVPAKPARNLFEGLQAIALVQLAIAIEGHALSVSVGLPDRALARFADDLPHDEAVELVGAFMLKMNTNAIFGSGSKTQAITVGGANAEGVDQSNRIAAAFLDACDRMRLGDPHVFLRWHPSLDPVIRATAARMLADGLSMPLLINDEPTAKGFEQAGMVPEDAWDYCVIGCNELGVPGRQCLTALASGGCNYLELLNEVLLEDGAAEAITDMNTLIERLDQYMRVSVARGTLGGAERLRHCAAEAPTPFTSSLMRACPPAGQDLHVCNTYPLRGFFERGLSNAADALATIESVVFDRHEMTLAELLRQMRDDFADSATPARLCDAPRWGNDDAAADRWTRVLLDMRTAALREAEADHDLMRHLPCHVVRSLHYMDGRRIAASPDGRHAGQPVSDSIGAAQGAAKHGPTAVLNSVLTVDAPHDYPGGYNLNITLPLGQVDGDRVLAMIEAFFGQGGQELQVNCLDGSVLRDAQARPEKHGDLLVRISGFSTLFTKLSKCEQDELIARADAAG